jgi:drug/metabolite transporter (DMT)-like permease
LGPLQADLVPNLIPASQPQFEGQALHFALLAAAASLFSLARGAPWPRGRQIWASVAIGLGLFTVPGILVALSQGWVSAPTRVALFSLVPVFAVIFEPHIGLGVEINGGLPAALAAVAGALFVYPLQVPHSIQSSLAVCAVVLAAACIAAVNCHAVRVAAALPAKSIAPLAALAGAAAALGFSVAGLLSRQGAWTWKPSAPELAWSVAIELPSLLLLFWLLPRISAVRMTTRFALAPLIAILIELALVRPTLELRNWLGLLLIAAASSWLLLAPREEPQANRLPLNLDKA